MKSYQLLRSALPFLLGTLAACGGESSIGSGGESGTDAGRGGGKPTGLGGGSAVGARAGNDAGGATSTGAGPSHGAMSGNGGGPAPQPGKDPATGEGLCMSDADCPEEPCQMCEDGRVSCKKTYCAENKCRNDNVNPCPISCTTGDDCDGVSGVGCVDCANGTQSCPTGSCVGGFCQINLKGCDIVDPCKGKACGAICDGCGGGGICDATAPSYCSRDGKCTPEPPMCPAGADCETTMDCGSPPPNCVSCGNGACAGFACIESKCVFACAANPECKVSEDCPMREVCNECSNGKCAVQACLQGSCELVCPFE